jgi:hypothetical protein
MWMLAVTVTVSSKSEIQQSRQNKLFFILLISHQLQYRPSPGLQRRWIVAYCDELEKMAHP